MMKSDFLLLTFLPLLLLGCIAYPAPIASETGDPRNSAGQGWYQVYFTEPSNPAAASYRGGPDESLAEAIRGARLSVDAAIYHLNLWSIRDALISAHQSGVAVRVVAESDNFDEVELIDLQEDGIEVLGDRRESFMHNKFVIIDKAEVWTGSMNFTINGAYRNDNNLLCIHSSRIAENYQAEFEEMFVSDMFGNNIMINTPHPYLELNDIVIETLFSPDDNTEGRILSYINGAVESIKFMVYSFTSDKIAEALIVKFREGVLVSGVIEESQYYLNLGTEYDRLLEEGIDVHLDGNRNNMHHKVMIIDDQVLIVGSYNFSRNAEFYNDENTLIINDPGITHLYSQEFDRIYQEALENGY